jgi:hypothetical protein
MRPDPADGTVVLFSPIKTDIAVVAKQTTTVYLRNFVISGY